MNMYECKVNNKYGIEIKDPQISNKKKKRRVLT